MWQQILAIAWAQFRITRNHLPRTTFGGALMWFLSLLWYGVYTAAAVALAMRLPDVPLPQLQHWLPVGLFGVFLFWQIVPLFTLSTGWSLQLNKLRVFPVSDSALFGIEVLLRVTSAPEMLIVLGGALVGLSRHPGIPLLAPLFLLLYIPFNLFLQLAIRDLILYSFERNRFRELFAALIISISILPQLLSRTKLGHILTPYFFATARAFRDPLAALLQKEFHSLLRMPRFRVLFGMACIFSVVVFIPVTFNQDFHHSSSFIHNNFLPIVNLYGLLLLSDVL